MLKSDRKAGVTQRQVTRRGMLQGTGGMLALGALQAGLGSRMLHAMDDIPMQSHQPIPDGTLTEVSVSVAKEVVGLLPPDFTGFSFEKDVMVSETLSGTSHNAIALFKHLGAGVLRLGGNKVDQTLWDPHGEGKTPKIIAPPDLDRVVAFVKATGWKVIYGINLATSSPQRAASEAYRVSRLFGDRLVGIEIGNEPDFFHLNPLGPAMTWTADVWIRNFVAFEREIHKSSPGVPIIGPALGMHMEYLDALVAAKVPNLEMFTIHYYVDANVNGSMRQMLTYPSRNLMQLSASVESRIGKTGKPFRYGECNSYAGGGLGGVSNSCGSSLWTIEYMLASALNRAAGVNFHANYKSTGYTPLSFNSTDVTGVQPEYYGMAFVAQAGTGKLLKTTLSAEKANISAFAIASDAGGLNVIVVNKDANKDLHLTLNAGRKVNSASLSCLTNPSLEALTGTRIQGGEIKVNGDHAPAADYQLVANGESVSCYVPSKGAVLVKMAQ